ncbi:hypothetical protein LINGRAHAP2_LOCUS24619 [Linum grandiflorum]
MGLTTENLKPSHNHLLSFSHLSLTLRTFSAPSSAAAVESAVAAVRTFHHHILLLLLLLLLAFGCYTSSSSAVAVAVVEHTWMDSYNHQLAAFQNTDSAVQLLDYPSVT